MKLLGWLLLTVLCVTPASGKFERPSETDRLRALGNLSETTEQLRQLFTPNDDFPPIHLPRSGDWLAQHTEKGQSFEAYRDSNANKPDATRHTLYLLPIGEFDEESSPSLKDVRAYAAAFFQMEVKLLPAHLPHDLEFEPRTNKNGGQRQLLTRSIRTFLKSQLPPDAYCLLGITMTDLYPAPSWNFVFGEATLAERVGVYSFARYDPAFSHEPRGKDYRSLILQRSCKVLAHETAHMFGLQHCIYYDCVVNGSNGMSETDSEPQHLCPVCLRKLHHTAGFDAVKRYEDLARFYRHQKWFEDYDWVQRQLEKISCEK
jgi:archaemetzincin